MNERLIENKVLHLRKTPSFLGINTLFKPNLANLTFREAVLIVILCTFNKIQQPRIILKKKSPTKFRRALNNKPLTAKKGGYYVIAKIQMMFHLIE